MVLIYQNTVVLAVPHHSGLMVRLRIDGDRSANERVRNGRRLQQISIVGDMVLVGQLLFATNIALLEQGVG